MSKILIDEATVKLVLGKIKAARDCHPNAVDTLLFEAEEILETELVEQPAQQEPFGYFKAEPFGWIDCAETDEGAVALYTTPQPAQRKPLTEEEIKKLAAPLFMTHYWKLCNEFARAIEAAHGIKENT